MSTWNYTPERHATLDAVLEGRAALVAETRGLALLVDGTPATLSDKLNFGRAQRAGLAEATIPDHGPDLGGRYPLHLTTDGELALGRFDQHDRGRVPELDGEWRVESGEGPDAAVMIGNGTLSMELHRGGETPHHRALTVILEALNAGAR